MRTIAFLVLLWLLLSAAGYWISNSIFETSELQELTTNGQSVYGQVLAKYPENHASISYSYVVDGVQYHGSGSAGFGNPPFDEIKPGQDVVVIYDPADPSISYLGSPEAKLINQRTGKALFTFTMSFVWLLILSIVYLVSRMIKKASLTDKLT